VKLLANLAHNSFIKELMEIRTNNRGETMHQLQPWNKKVIAAIFVCAVPVSFTHASGFRIPEVSVTGTATSNTLVANTEELGSLPYNPAAISFHEGNHVMAGINHISYETTVTPDGGTRTDGVGEDTFLVPNLIVSTTGDNKMGFAILVNSPFGLETEWPDETFPQFAGAADPLEPQLSRIKMFNINPNLSYKIDKDSSIAIGIDFYDVVDLNLNTQAIPVRGSGTGVGMNVGLLQKMGNLSFGLSYRSSVTTNIKGHFDATGIGSSVISAKARLEFPDILQLGIHYKPTEQIGIEFNADRTGWSSFNEINVTDSTGNTLGSVSTNNWKNSWAYRLGFNWKITPGTKLLLGYSYDNTPQPDANFSARVPDADRQLFSIGASHELDDWKIEYAYMYVDVDDRTLNSSTPFAGGDANGTTAYNGTYESDVSLIGLSATIKF
jgi:long-chain fatty acid transport protein